MAKPPPSLPGNCGYEETCECLVGCNAMFNDNEQLRSCGCRWPVDDNFTPYDAHNVRPNLPKFERRIVPARYIAH